MSRKNLMFALGGVLLLIGSVAVVAGIGGDDDNQSSDLNGNGNGFPGGDDDCICPQYYAPVVCVQPLPDGTFMTEQFSNSCFAGCAGYTRCFSAQWIR